MADKVCLPTASDIESQIPSERVLTSNSVARVCAHIIMFLLALMLIMVTTITIAAAMVWVDMTYGNSSESFDTLFEKSVGRALGAQTCIMICCMLIYLAYSWRLMLDLHRPSTHAPSEPAVAGEPGIGSCTCSCGMFACLFHCHLRA